MGGRRKMKVLGLVGSPRKEGNTQILVEEALAGARDSGAETEIIQVSDLNFQFCQGCMKCRSRGECVNEDDLGDVLEKLDQADGIVIGSPVYGHYLPGQLKAVFDRLGSMSMLVKPNPNGIIIVESRLTKKVRNGLAITVCSAPYPEMTEATLVFLKGFLVVHSNGGKMREIRANKLGMPGQLKMGLEELKDLAKTCGFPEESTLQMQEHHQQLLIQARELGSNLRGQENN